MSYISPELLTILMFGSLIIALFMGHSITFVMGGLSVIFGLIAWGTGIFDVFIGRIYGVMDNYVLISIPLFLFMAQLLERSNVAEDLFDSIGYLMGSLRGGVAIAVIAVSTLFGACTGIIGASIVAMATLGLPIMLKYGYDKKLASGVIMGGGTLGILIPPSIMLVFIASESGASVGKLFAGAIIPGLILSGLYMIYIAIICHLKPEMGPPLSVEVRASVSKKEVIKMVSKSLIPPLLLILGVLGSIFTGIATPTEAAGVGCVLAFALVCAYGKFSWKMFMEALKNTGKSTSMVLWVAVAANCFTTVFLNGGGGIVIKELMLGSGLGKWGIFIVMMAIFFILGMFIDWLGILLITLPIFIPIIQELGFDHLWFLVIVAVVLQTSFLTPPLGYALIYFRGVSPPEITTEDIWLGGVPFCILMLIGVLICTVFPSTVTWLPALITK